MRDLTRGLSCVKLGCLSSEIQLACYEKRCLCVIRDSGPFPTENTGRRQAHPLYHQVCRNWPKNFRVQLSENLCVHQSGSPMYNWQSRPNPPAMSRSLKSEWHNDPYSLAQSACVQQDRNWSCVICSRVLVRQSVTVRAFTLIEKTDLAAANG